MNRSLWALALLVDTLALVATTPFFFSEPTGTSFAWGGILVVLFGALLILLLKPQFFGRHAPIAAKSLCVALPVVAFLGSLDMGRISGQEVYAIALAAILGWLNWAAFRRHAANVAPKAA